MKDYIVLLKTVQGGWLAVAVEGESHFAVQVHVSGLIKALGEILSVPYVKCRLSSIPMLDETGEATKLIEEYGEKAVRKICGFYPHQRLRIIEEHLDAWKDESYAKMEGVTDYRGYDTGYVEVLGNYFDYSP